MYGEVSGRAYVPRAPHGLLGIKLYADQLTLASLTDSTPVITRPKRHPENEHRGPSGTSPSSQSHRSRPCAAALTSPFCWAVQEEPHPKATPAASGGEGSTSGSVVAPAPASASLLKPALRPTAIEFKPKSRLTAAANEFRPGGVMKVGSPSFVPGPSLSGVVKAPVVPAVTQPPQPSLVKEVRGHVTTHWSFFLGGGKLRCS